MESETINQIMLFCVKPLPPAAVTQSHALLGQTSEKVEPDLQYKMPYF